MGTKPKLEPKDKRSKLDLNLFLIALIKRGINTPYSLHGCAGLSPGATIPVLKRLNAAGYLRRGDPGIRKRSEYRVTAKGSRYLDSNWPQMLESSVPTDIEAILRTASLGILCGADRKCVAAYLKRSAQAKTTKSTEAPLPAITKQADLYAWMRSVHVEARQASDAEVLRQLASALLNRKWSF
jgi:DNA-binding PadR family transcriptional regulator